jgi:hypothetical protein
MFGGLCQFLEIERRRRVYYLVLRVKDMGVVEQSHETVESYISALERIYGSFAVNQSTLSVPPAEYKRECERAAAGYADLYVTVTNSEGDVLHVDDGDEHVVPSTRAEGIPAKTMVAEFVEDETGVPCHVEDVKQATILGIRSSASDSETVYRLAIVFEARPASTEDGTGPPSTAETAVWQGSAEVPEIVAP